MNMSAGDAAAPARKGALTLRFPGLPDRVRAALRQVHRHLTTLPLPTDRQASIELVVAEALNNIAEHAYADAAPGAITLIARHDDDRLSIVLRDTGRPLPGLAPPAGAPPDLDVATADLPEGGYGWFLIRDLTDDVGYLRQGGENQLTLEFSTA